MATSLLLLGLLPAHAQRLPDRNLEISLADARLLRNVEPLENATRQLLRLRPVRYQVQSPVSPALLGPQRLGFVAQQMLAVYPGLVHRDYDAAGTLRVDYTPLVPVLTRALQEQVSLVSRLQAQQDEMNKELVELRAENSRLTVGLAAVSVGGNQVTQVQQLQQQVAQLQRAVGQLQLALSAH